MNISIRKLSLVWIILPLSMALSAQNPATGVIRVRKPRADAVTSAPEFPGGDPAMQTFIRTNTDYPEAARTAGITGNVDVSFKIAADGKISDAKIAKGIGSGCDEAALKMVRAMPPWKPAKLNRDNVAVQYVLHIPFPPGNIK